MKTFSDNLVFWDTEFSHHDISKSEILSIGMIDMDGSELYLEIEHDGEVGGWVKENILPTLTGEKVSKEEARRQITEFLGNKEGADRPYLVASWDKLDVAYLLKLFRLDDDNDAIAKFPWQKHQIDFASMLFAWGINPRAASKTNPLPIGSGKDLYEELGIDKDKYNLHNALDDAKILREVYIKMMEKYGGK